MDKRVIIIGDGILPITYKIGEIFCKNFKELNAYIVNDIDGEDHFYAIDEHKKPMFDLLVSSARKFVFLWYYIHPSKGMLMVEEMKKECLGKGFDYAVKFPNVPVKKEGWPSIVRYGKKPAGIALEKFIVKAGNPQLCEDIFSQENLNTYRSYDWYKVPNALNLILEKAKKMVPLRLKNNPDKINNIRGYCLYAGCAYSYVYPKLGFGMRDIDVEVLFSPEWYTNTRCAFTRPCGIKKFGTPEYFKGHTRWLDLMWNSFHTETGNFKHDVIQYINEMRMKSDRWSTMSQRPFIDLETERIIYKPNWLKKLEKENIV
jgi:hypothetical protein